MVDAHGTGFYKENGITPSGTPLGSGTSTPQSGASAPVFQTKTAPTTAPVPADDPSVNGRKNTTINTTTLRLDGQFMSSAADLFDVLTDETKIPMWSRNPAKVRVSRWVFKFFHESQDLIFGDM